MYLVIKRAIDFTLSLIGLIVLSPLFLILIIAIKLDSSGPVLFKQKRVGIHKKYFYILKFRTMRIDTPKDTPTHLLQNPEQWITRVGKFLRKTSLDELPQIINILKGEMSIVGPRPALWNQYDLIAERDKYGANDVPVGLTGWAQINGRDELEIIVKAKLDGEYVNKLGVLIDFKCFFGTILSVLRSKGVVEGGTGKYINDKNQYTDVKKALIVSTVASTIDQFCMKDIYLLQEMSYEVSVFANFTENNNTSEERLEKFRKVLKNASINVYESNMQRKIGKIKENYQVYNVLKEHIKKHNYTIIHCHTPIAALIARLAAKNERKNGTKVIYTAHGFHFFKSAPLINWMFYFPIEYIISFFTDVLITINKEDYFRAKKMKAKSVKYIPGIGIDAGKINNILIDREKKRYELGINNDDILILSVGELNDNKNHEVILRAITKLNNKNVVYMVVGKDNMNGYLHNLSIELGAQSQLILTGYRQDVIEICKASDIFAFPSKREGLGIAALEAMASGLPLITSNVHGIVDYSIDGITGYCCSPTDVDGLSEAISRLVDNYELRYKLGQNNIEAVKKFDYSNVKIIMKEIYENIC